MDRLEQRIQDKRNEIAAVNAEIENLSRKNERLSIELDAMIEAASLRPLQSLADKKAASKPRKRAAVEERRTSGRQKGAISKEWKRVLEIMIEEGNQAVPYEVIHRIARDTGLDVQIHSVRDRVRGYVENGLLDETRGKYRVSKSAMERFGFAEKVEAPAEKSESASQVTGGAGTPPSMN